MGNEFKIKICNCCKESKSERDFSKDKKTKDGFKYDCKSCRNLKEKIRLSDPEKREKEKIRNRLWRKNNPQSSKDTVKKYRNSNKEKFKKYQRDYARRKRKENVAYKLSSNTSRAIRYCLFTYAKIEKTLPTFEALGYSVEQLKEHLEKQFEPWMNWNNYGKFDKYKKTWQIDHIVPASSFIYASMQDEQFKKCWALENLRPLEAIENIKKGDRLVF